MMDDKQCVRTKLCAFSFGIALGVTEAIFMMVLAWVAGFCGYGDLMVQQIATVYYGYAPSFVGGILGGLWGLADGFVFGLVAGWIYNCCLCHCHKRFSGEAK